MRHCVQNIDNLCQKEYNRTNMPKMKFSKVIPVALILIIAAIVIAGIITIVRSALSPNGASSTSIIDGSRAALLDSSAETAVTMSVRGPIIADEQFSVFQIKITPNSRTATSYKGYLSAPTALSSLNNNVTAYEQFVYALDKANFALGSDSLLGADDLRGICATGNVYEFNILSGDQSVKHLWTSTCSGSRGNLRANLAQVTNLFYAQIPDSQSLTSSVWR